MSESETGTGGDRTQGSGAVEERSFQARGQAWLASVPWRGADGAGMCYVRPERPEASDREDRRARLREGRALDAMDEGELQELLEDGAPLTETERRFRGPDGRWWLAQNVGPVWAEEEAAEGATGILFTALEGEGERVRADDGDHVARLGAQELVEAWRGARGVDDPGRGGDGGGGG